MEDYDKFNSKMTAMSVNSLLTDLGKKAKIKINLNPQYQRDKVWSQRQQALFIKALLMNKAPQNVIFNNDKKSKEKICIDGKQRISSILGFSENEFPITIGKEDVYYSDLPDDADEENDRVMTDDEQQVFLQRDVGVVEYTNLTYTQQASIFYALQNGTKLSRGEKVVSLILDEKDAKYLDNWCKTFTLGFTKFVNISRKDHYRVIIEYLYSAFNNKIYEKGATVDKWIIKIELDGTLKTKLKSIKDNLTYGLEILNSDLVPKMNKKLFYTILFGLNQHYPVLKPKSKQSVVEFVKAYHKNVITLKIDMTQKAIDVYTELYKLFKAQYKEDFINKNESDDELEDSEVEEPESEDEEESDDGSDEASDEASDEGSENEEETDKESDEESDEEIVVAPKKNRKKKTMSKKL